MKKLSILMLTGAACMCLCACDQAGLESFDPSVLEEASRSIEEFSKSVNEVQGYVNEIQAEVKNGIDNTNAAMDWYQNEAIPDNPYISRPITEEKVEGLIRSGQDELNSYIEAYLKEYVDANASYDVLSSEDIDFFTEYFSDEAFNGFLLSTYETPDKCDVMEALSRNSAIIKNVKSSDKDHEGRIKKSDVDAVLEKTLGIDSSGLAKPLDFENDYLYIDKKKSCVDVVCKTGFYYNDLYFVLMRNKQADATYYISLVSRDADDNVMIQMNFISDDLMSVEWNGTLMYELYNMLLESDLAAAITIPGNTGDLSLGAAFDGKKKISRIADLVSDKKDDVMVYMQSFDGYDVYYSNLDPEAAEEFIVSQIDITGGDFKTAEGVGIGTSIDELKEIYGEGIKSRIAGGKQQLVYQMGKYDMLYVIDKAGKVEEITMFLADKMPQE